MDRVEKSKKLFTDGHNCSQAVVGAYSDLFGVEPQTAMIMAEGFGGGMGRMRLTCGAVSGMVALVGMKYSNGIAADTQTRTKIYEKVREVLGEFTKRNGTIVCGELLGLKGNEKEIEDRFYKDLEFGTAGLRGVIAAGTNRINIYTVRRATFGLANYIMKNTT